MSESATSTTTEPETSVVTSDDETSVEPDVDEPETDSLQDGAGSSGWGKAKTSVKTHLSSLRQLQDLVMVKARVNTLAVNWNEERECLMLLLKARMLLHNMIQIRVKEERFERGDLSIGEIQNLLKGQKEDNETDWIAEIQELKRNMVAEIRRNHTLERELGRLDKRIALLIKHRTNIKALLQAQQTSKKRRTGTGEGSAVVQLDPRQLEGYQNLFYLLQTEPQYLARLVTYMQPEMMEQFLDTVILTLFGDAFSPREEFLILSLFRIAIEQEMSKIKSAGDLTSADSVVPKMVISYNRRKQGLDFLKHVIAPVLDNVTSQSQLNLELNALQIYQNLLMEPDTPGRAPLERGLNEEQIGQLPQVREVLNARLEKLKEIAGLFLEAIVGSLARLPYGIRWICKQIQSIAQKNFESTGEQVAKVIGYFVYYRFMNLAIVTPDAWGLVEKELSINARKNLVVVGKVLQNLFTLNLFQNQGSEKWLLPLNEFISQRFDAVRRYFEDLVQVTDPSEYLRVDKYNELTLKVNPVIIISLEEISRTHKLLLELAPSLRLRDNDPLSVILRDLPVPLSVTDDTDREIQLTLVNRFKDAIEDQIQAGANLYAETKELVIQLFKALPQQQDTTHTFVDTLAQARQFAAETQQAGVAANVERIQANLRQLEQDGVISGAQDNYEGFLRGVALEVANRAEIREQQRKERMRLTVALRELRKHQAYITEQIDKYHQYIKDVLAHFPVTTIKPVTLPYKELLKQGVIVDSEVPSAMQKLTKFTIKSETPGVFDIDATMGGKTVDTIQLELDDLLEKSHNSIPVLKLEHVSLDVNMTLQMLNKYFLKTK